MLRRERNWSVTAALALGLLGACGAGHPGRLCRDPFPTVLWRFPDRTSSLFAAFHRPIPCGRGAL